MRINTLDMLPKGRLISELETTHSVLQTPSICGFQGETLLAKDLKLVVGPKAYRFWILVEILKCEVVGPLGIAYAC